MRLAVVAALAVCCVLPAGAVAQTYMYQERMGQPFNELCSGVPCGVWNTPLPAANTGIDPESANLVGVLGQYFPGPSGNRANFGIDGGFSLWIAPPGTPLVTVTLTNSFHPGLQNVLNQVPIPAGAHPSDDTDARMAVYQPSTDCEWEFWRASDSNGAWTASTGGRDCNVKNSIGVYKNVQDAAGNTLEANTWASGAAGFENMAGAPMVDELAHGVIPHAIGFAIGGAANCAGLRAQPAERTDGTTTPVLDANGEPTNCIPEGARFRLPPPCPAGTASTLGVCYNVSDLTAEGAPPLVVQMATAVQTFGLVDVNSTSGGTVPVESASVDTNVFEALGANPYTTAVAGEANTPFLGSYTSRDQAALALFPWNYLELTQMSVTSSPDPAWYLTPDPPAPLWPN